MKMLRLAAVLVAGRLLTAVPQTLACATAEAPTGSVDDDATDIVPVSVSPRERVLAAVPGGGGASTGGTPVCLQCKCCSKSNPAKCWPADCCSVVKCDQATRKCNLIPLHCGCDHCGTN